MSEDMRVAGIICEYNPFHSGHAHHIASTREAAGADAVACLMSGEFTQRGSPSITDKWTRTRLALAGGADIVLELPFLHATQSAQGFAAGGARILDAIGVDLLSFGAETPDVRALDAASALLDEEPETFRDALRAALDAGHSYAVAQRQAASAVDPSLGALLESPNNLLATQYLRAMRALGSRMRPVAIQRIGVRHSSDVLKKGTHPSSTAIRREIAENGALGPELLADTGVPQRFSPVLGDERLFLLTAARLRSAEPEDLADIPDMEAGLAWRMTKTARKAACWSDLVNGIATRRYPAARVRRLLLHTLLGVRKEDIQAANAPNAPLHARVLGVRRESLPVLSELDSRSRIPLSASPGILPRTILTDMDERACDLYGLLMDPVRPAGANRSTRLVLV